MNAPAATEHQEQTQINVEEKIALLFEPDTLVFAQYFDTLRRRALSEPEKRLVLAILEDAINCFQDNLLMADAKRKKLFEQTEEWILEKDADWIFSFANACEILGLNPEYVRQGLLRWKEKNLAGHRGGSVWQETKMAG